MKNEYKITKDLFKSWAKEFHLHGAANIFLFSLWCAFGIFGIIGLIFLLILQADWLGLYIYSLIFAISLYKLFIERIIFCSKRYKALANAYGVTEWMHTTEFLDDEIVISDHTTISKVRYCNIKKIKEKNNVIIIFLKDNMALRLYKDAFVEGSWEECEKMLLEKMELK